MQEELFAPTPSYDTFAEVILPLALPKAYTYAVPPDLTHLLKVGMRVEVQFGKNKLYAALVENITHTAPKAYTPKPLLSILDLRPIAYPIQFKFWKWMADYYCCTLGEVMNASMPAGLKLSSEARLIISPIFDGNYTELEDDEYMLAEALAIQNEMTVGDVQKLLNKKTVYPIINKLLEQKIIYLKEELKTKYKPKLVTCVRLAESYRADATTLKDAFARVGNANRQMETLLAYVQLSKQQQVITRKELCELAQVSTSVVNALVKKKIFELYDKSVSRLASYEEALEDRKELSPQQERAISEIQATFKEKNVVLLHGVTGSGKTRVYMELIEKAIANGEQVLYLLPEIALTTQLVTRLQKIFGDNIAVYHSRMNNNERVEIWHETFKGKPIILSARSGIFLPFANLKLIIVDEEHDPSFKQTDPSPRYNARDMAVLMAQMHNAKVILGTATPSVETYHNTKKAKYGLVEMPERFGGIKLPEIKIIDAKKETQQRTMKSHFTSALINILKETLDRGEQAILFQNRRGYAPRISCNTCGWNAQCVNCDISLTYHKYSSNLKCHLCSYENSIPKLCPACGSSKLSIKGFGTEKIEDELQIFFPDARIGRMDWDTVKTKNAHARIIRNFEDKKIDILVGTQMVTKGLDFDNVTLVGVLSADHLLYFPDFRATERAFQLMTQVSGRSGRKKKQGRVIIQAFNTDHPVLEEVLKNDYQGSFQREITERQGFHYPPFYRLISVTLKHKKREKLDEGAKLFSRIIKGRLKSRVLGPTVPNVSRIRTYYIMNILIKLELSHTLIKSTKDLLMDTAVAVKREKGLSSLKINIDVDPY